MNTVSVLDRIADCADQSIGALGILVSDSGQTIPKQHAVIEGLSTNTAAS